MNNKKKLKTKRKKKTIKIITNPPQNSTLFGRWGGIE